MNGFDSSQSAWVIVTGSVAANAANTDVPSIEPHGSGLRDDG